MGASFNNPKKEKSLGLSGKRKWGHLSPVQDAETVHSYNMTCCLIQELLGL